MAQSVNGAFNEFNRDYVNLDPNRTDIARSSRDWLIEQLKNLPYNSDDFPQLYNDKHIKYGSFARKTKIRELDDIDLILTFHASGTTYLPITYGQHYLLYVPDTAVNLRRLCNSNGTLNSTRLINKVISSLGNIPQYKSAETHRMGVAATLSLTTYEWVFDIVPAFYTDTGYYLIPDGSGNWKATDPRIDQDRVTTINQKHEGKILQIIRTLKYWNRRASMPTIYPYLFENIVLNYFEDLNSVTDWLRVDLCSFWQYLMSAIYNPVPDPKEFQGDLNTICFEDRLKISQKSADASDKALEALTFEASNETSKSLAKWGEIFGPNFPGYG